LPQTSHYPTVAPNWNTKMTHPQSVNRGGELAMRIHHFGPNVHRVSISTKLYLQTDRTDGEIELSCCGLSLLYPPRIFSIIVDDNVQELTMSMTTHVKVSVIRRNLKHHGSVSNSTSNPNVVSMEGIS
jgi:hypothetical protein